MRTHVFVRRPVLNKILFGYKESEVKTCTYFTNALKELQMDFITQPKVLNYREKLEGKYCLVPRRFLAYLTNCDSPSEFAYLLFVCTRYVRRAYKARVSPYDAHRYSGVSVVSLNKAKARLIKKGLIGENPYGYRKEYESNIIIPHLLF